MDANGITQGTPDEARRSHPRTDRRDHGQMRDLSAQLPFGEAEGGAVTFPAITPREEREYIAMARLRRSGFFQRNPQCLHLLLDAANWNYWRANQKTFEANKASRIG